RRPRTKSRLHRQVLHSRSGNGRAAQAARHFQVRRRILFGHLRRQGAEDAGASIHHPLQDLEARLTASIMPHTRGGDNGRSWIATPSEASAAATAFAITPPTGMMPPSPAPLAPSGLFGDGYCSNAITRMSGNSPAVGCR